MFQIYLIAIAALLLLLIVLNRHYLLRKDEFLQKEFEKKKKREQLAQIAKEDVSEKKTILKEEVLEQQIKKEEINFTQISSFIKRAETLIAKDLYDEGEKLLVQVLSLDKENFVANSMLALLYLKNHFDSKAEVIYLRLLEIKPKDPALYTNLGLAFYNQAKYQDALEAYSYAVALDPKSAARHINVGQVYFVVRDLENAIQHFQEAVKIAPRDVECWFMLADTYREKGELAEAKKAYNKVLHYEPYNNEAQEEVRRLVAMGY